MGSRACRTNGSLNAARITILIGRNVSVCYRTLDERHVLRFVLLATPASNAYAASLASAASRDSWLRELHKVCWLPADVNATYARALLRLEKGRLPLER